MSIRRMFCFLPFVLLLACFTFAAQSPDSGASAPAISASHAAVPRLLRFSGNIEGLSGTLGVTFALYKDQAGGAPLWVETQNVVLDQNGRYAIYLGANHARGVPAELFASGEARWLGVQADGQAEQSRVLLVSVPYALRAASADSLGGVPATAFVRAPLDAEGNYVNTAAVTAAVAAVSGTGSTGKLVKWADTNGALTDSIVSESGSSIGIAGALSTTDGSGIGIGPYGNVRLNVGGTQASGNIAFGMYMGSLTLQPATGWDALFHYGGGGTVDTGAGNTIGKAVGFFGEAIQKAGTGTITNTYGLWINPSTSGTNNYAAYFGGNVGIGTTTPTEKLDVAGTVRAQELAFTDGTFQTTAGKITSIATAAGSGLTGGGNAGNLNLAVDYTAVQARVGSSCPTGQAISAIAQAGTVTCQSVGGGGGAYLPLTGGTLTGNLAGTTAGFSGSTTPPTYILTATQGATGVAPPSGAPTPAWIATVPAAIVGTAAPSSGVSAGVVGMGTTGTGIGVVGIASAADAPAIVAFQTNTGSANGDAIDASIQSTGWAAAIYAESLADTGSGSGIQAKAYSPQGYAAMFNNYGGGSIIWGGVGEGQSSTRFSVTGSQTDIMTATTNISGSVHINGTLSKPAGTFKIDHPLDPENKYLYHSFVESPDMKNIYDGVVKLNARGEAWVELPDYFEALNQDFRYQLTAVGAPGPNLYVAKKIFGNRFKIAGGRRGMEVSWMVTGIRHDAYADAHRINVEVEKSGAERGTYLHPELFKKKDGKAVNAAAPAAAQHIPVMGQQ